MNGRETTAKPRAVSALLAGPARDGGPRDGLEGTQKYKENEPILLVWSAGVPRKFAGV
jgi:hypothetical protein